MKNIETRFMILKLQNLMKTFQHLNMFSYQVMISSRLNFCLVESVPILGNHKSLVKYNNVQSQLLVTK